MNPPCATVLLFLWFMGAARGCVDRTETFDNDPVIWENVEKTALDKAVKASGAGAWRVGDLAEPGKSVLKFDATAQPERLTMAAAVITTGGAFSLQARSGSEICFEVHYNVLGWNIGYFKTGVKPLPEVFRQLDIHMDWDNQLVTLFVDGKLGKADVPFTNMCGSGVDDFQLSGQGWIDDFKLWCGPYLTTSGDIFGHDVSHDDYRGGGLAVTLTLHGGQTWTQTAVDDLPGTMTAAGTGSDTGWNALAATLLGQAVLDTSKAVLVVPFNSVPSFLTLQPETVRIQLSGAMISDGVVPPTLDTDLSFTVPGRCPISISQGFEFAMPTLPASIERTDKEAYKGTFSLHFPKGGTVYEVKTPALMPTEVSFAGRVLKGSERLTVELDMGVAFKLIIGYNSQFAAMIDFNGQPFGAVSPSTWHVASITIDWDKRIIQLYADGVNVFGLNMPADMNEIKGIRVYSNGDGVFFDELKVSCPRTDPVVKVQCSDQVDGGLSFVFKQGSDAMSPSDRVAIVPSEVAAASYCSKADTECLKLEACSQSAGMLRQAEDTTQWETGKSTLIVPGTPYAACYFLSRLGEYVLAKGTVLVQSCQDAPTSIPSTTTPAIETSVPGTPSPATQTPVSKDTTAPSINLSTQTPVLQSTPDPAPGTTPSPPGSLESTPAPALDSTAPSPRSSPAPALDSTPSPLNNYGITPAPELDITSSPSKGQENTPAPAHDISPSPLNNHDGITPGPELDLTPSPSKGQENTPAPELDITSSPSNGQENTPAPAHDISPSPLNNYGITSTPELDLTPSPSKGQENTPAPAHDISPSPLNNHGITPIPAPKNLERTPSPAGVGNAGLDSTAAPAPGPSPSPAGGTPSPALVTPQLTSPAPAIPESPAPMDSTVTPEKPIPVPTINSVETSVPVAPPTLGPDTRTTQMPGPTTPAQDPPADTSNPDNAPPVVDIVATPSPQTTAASFSPITGSSGAPQQTPSPLEATTPSPPAEANETVPGFQQDTNETDNSSAFGARLPGEEEEENNLMLVLILVAAGMVLIGVGILVMLLKRTVKRNREIRFNKDIIDDDMPFEYAFPLELLPKTPLLHHRQDSLLTGEVHQFTPVHY